MTLSRTFQNYLRLELLLFIDEQGCFVSERTIKLEMHFQLCYLLRCLHELKNEGLLESLRDDEGWAYLELTEEGRKIVDLYRGVSEINAQFHPPPGR